MVHYVVPLKIQLDDTVMLMEKKKKGGDENTRLFLPKQLIITVSRQGNIPIFMCKMFYIKILLLLIK